MITLQQIMKTNAASCVVFGFIFLLIPREVGTFLSTDSAAPELTLAIIGIVLIINGIHLIWASQAPKPNKSLVLYFSAGDYAWIIASIFLVISGIWVNSIPGVISTLLVATIVGILGTLQLLKINN